MKDIKEVFEKAIQKAKERNFKYLYIAVDVHGTIFKSSRKTRQIWSKNPNPSELIAKVRSVKEFDFLPYAEEALKLLSDHPRIKLILWTSTQNAWELVFELKQHGIKIDYLNSNPDFQFNSYADFTRKFCFDVLLDDKAGFDPEVDWKEILSVDLSGLYKEVDYERLFRQD